MIDALDRMLDIWGQKRIPIAEGYLEQKINDYPFLYDAVGLALYVSRLGQHAYNLFEVGESTTLMHNRVIAQTMSEYASLGCKVNSRPVDFLSPRRHDFDVMNLRCEVKTVQALGKLERFVLGGRKLSSSTYETLTASLRDHLGKAREQAGRDGMIFLSFWSYALNGLLEATFRDEKLLQTVIPPPTQNTTVLCITSFNAFLDYYVVLRGDLALSILEKYPYEYSLWWCPQCSLSRNTRWFGHQADYCQ